MTKVLLLCLLITNITYGQIYTQSAANGSILITPNGLMGKNNFSTDTTNVALGSSTLKSNTVGKYNTASGNSALYSNTGGNLNTAIGFCALQKNTTGNSNSANGCYALRWNSTGSNNTANGNFALFFNTIGFSNTAAGSDALHFNSTGSGNTANGNQALWLNETGNYNTANGSSSLRFNIAGSYNTASGTGALANNTTGNSNTSDGYLSLKNNTIGSKNTAIGDSAGYNNITGSNNTFIGYFANVDSAGYTNTTAIGAYATVNNSNKIRIGNDAVTVIEGAVPFSTPSDRRLKQNITPTLVGLSFISRLTPMSYTYIADKTNVRRDGLIAQDVEKVMKELGVEFSGLQKSPDGTYSLAYSDFVMPLVNAAKELKQQNDEQQTEIDVLKKKLSRMEELVKRILALEANAGTNPTNK